MVHPLDFNWGEVISFLKAHLLYKYIDVKDSLPRLALSTISPLFVNLDVLYEFATYDLIRKPFLMVGGVKMAGVGVGFEF